MLALTFKPRVSCSIGCKIFLCHFRNILSKELVFIMSGITKRPHSHVVPCQTPIAKWIKNDVNLQTTESLLQFSYHSSFRNVRLSLHSEQVTIKLKRVLLWLTIPMAVNTQRVLNIQQNHFNMLLSHKNETQRVQMTLLFQRTSLFWSIPSSGK